MNESVIRQSAAIRRSGTSSAIRLLKRRSSATYGYAFLVAALLSGWMLREAGIVDPAQGPGYWLGIAGATMMLFLLLYPLRKKMRWLGVFGSIRNWFQIHVVLGLLGPLLVLYHCNFSLGSFNSKVALYCMLLVAGSGVFGLHFYSRIHRGLNGNKISLQELQDEMAETMKANHGMAALMPKLISRLEMLAAELQGDAITRSIGVARSLKWTLKQGVVRFRLKRMAKRELLVRAAVSAVIARDIKRLGRAADRHIDGHVKQMGRVAQYSLYERLFSLWHIFHLPLFLMLLLSACMHVLAVHMY